MWHIIRFLSNTTIKDHVTVQPVLWVSACSKRQKQFETTFSKCFIHTGLNIFATIQTSEILELLY